MSVVDWVCKKISLESASERLSAITISRQEVLNKKCFPASLTHAQTLPLAVMVHRRRFLKNCSLKFCDIWHNFDFYRILNHENFKTEVEQTKQRKRHILPVDQNLSSVCFLLAKFQLVSCNLSLAMIWQTTYTHKLLKLCPATLNVSVEPRATFTSARGFRYIASNLFTQEKITRQWKSTLSRQDRTALDQKNPYNPLEQS